MKIHFKHPWWETDHGACGWICTSRPFLRTNIPNDVTCLRCRGTKVWWGAQTRKQEVKMQLTMTKIVPVIFKESGKFRHPDGTRSWHKAGYVHNADTGEKLGPAMYTFSKDYLDSFAYNQKDLDYAIREGTKCQFLCFTGKDNKDYAIEVKKARELVKTGNAILITPTDGKSPFYRFDLCDITGERLESPF